MRYYYWKQQSSYFVCIGEGDHETKEQANSSTGFYISETKDIERPKLVGFEIVEDVEITPLPYIPSPEEVETQKEQLRREIADKTATRNNMETLGYDTTKIDIEIQDLKDRLEAI